MEKTHFTLIFKTTFFSIFVEKFLKIAKEKKIGPNEHLTRTLTLGVKGRERWGVKS